MFRKCVIALAAAALIAAATATSDIATESSRAVQSVRYQAEYARQTAATYGAKPDPGYLYSVAALNYTAGHVSVSAYGYAAFVNHDPLPSGTVEDILAKQEGICGHAAIVFSYLLNANGYQTRQIQLYLGGTGHVVVEVWYAGQWHFFDPTFQDYYVKDGAVLSLAQARALTSPGQYMVADKTNIYRQLMYWTHLEQQSGMTLPTNPATRVQY